MGWLSDSFKAITGDITDAFKSGNPSDIYHALAEVPGSPEATLEAIIGAISGKYNWNPYGSQTSWGDVMGGGTRESQGDQQRKLGRTIGTAIGLYFLGGLGNGGESSAGGEVGAAGGSADAGGIEAAMDGPAFGGGSSMGSAADSYYGLTAADNAAIDNAVEQSMAEPWTASDQVAVDTAGQSGFTDPTTGLQYDSGGLGQGTSSQPDWWSSLKDTYSKGSNVAKLLNALQSVTQKTAVPVGTSGYGSPSSSMGSGGVPPSTTNESGMILDNPVSQMTISQPLQAPKQQEHQNYGLIDISPANTPFQLSGTTWNQQLANALRNRNAY